MKTFKLCRRVTCSEYIVVEARSAAEARRLANATSPIRSFAITPEVTAWTVLFSTEQQKQLGKPAGNCIRYSRRLKAPPKNESS